MRNALSPILLAALVLAGCRSDDRSSSDSADAIAVDAGSDAFTDFGPDVPLEDVGDVGADAVLDAPSEPDVPPLPDIQELPVSVYSVDTRVDRNVMEAGSSVAVTCVFLDVDGDEVIPGSSAPPRFSRAATPARGSQIDSEGTFTATTAGLFEVRCGAAEYGLIDATPATVEVTPGPAWSVLANVVPSQMVAGGVATVECAVFDEYGNRIDGVETAAAVSPSGDGVTLGDHEITVTRAGFYDVSCDVAGATEIVPEGLEVLPAEATSLAVELVPARELYALGDVVALATVVTDAFGNPIADAPVRKSAAPAVPRFGDDRFRFDTEGVFVLSATLALSDPESPPLVATAEAIVNSEGPDIRCDESIDGVMIDAAPGTPIVVSGTVFDPSGPGTVRIGGTEAELDLFGRFAIEVPAEYGINFVDIEATDAFGAPNSTTCAFLVADDYTADGGWLDGDVGFSLRQAAMDDGSRSGGINSIADLLHLALASPELVSTLDSALRASNPVYPSQCVQEVCGGFLGCTCAYRLSISYRNGTLRVNGPNDVTLTLVDGGLRVIGNIRNVSLGLSIGGTVSTNGTVGLSSLGIDMTFNLGLDGSGRPSVSLRSINSVSVGSVNTDFSGLAGFIVDIIAGLAEGTIRDLIRNTLRDYLRDSFTEILDGVVSGLDIRSLGSSFNVPRLDGSGEINLGLGVRFSTINVTPARALFGIGTRFTGPSVRTGPTLGAPRPAGAVLLDPPTSRSVAASLQHGLLNQVLHTLWRGGMFDATIGSSSLGGSLPDGLSASLATGLPPVAVGLAGDSGAVEVHLGAAHLDLIWPGLFDDPLAIRLGAVVETAVSVVGDDLVFADVRLTELHFTTDTVRLDAATRDVIEDFLVTLVQGIVDDALNSALPALPIPSFARPSSLTDFGLPTGELGLQSPSLGTLPSHFVVEGNLGVR